MGIWDDLRRRQAAAHQTGLERGQAFAQGSPYTGLAGNKGRATKGFSRQLYGEMPERYGRTQELQGRYDSALADPAGTAGQFTDFFKRAAQGFAAPAQRDFEHSVSNVQANTAARFGGNASGEELRNVYNAGDAFSRNLTESLSQLAPQEAEMGLRHTGQLGEAAGRGADEQDRLAQLILAAIQSGGGGVDWGKILGTAGGIAAAAA
jgi:hypothetical protein